MTGNVPLTRCFCIDSAWVNSLPTHLDWWASVLTTTAKAEASLMAV